MTQTVNREFHSFVSTTKSLNALLQVNFIIAMIALVSGVVGFYFPKLGHGDPTELSILPILDLVFHVTGIIMFIVSFIFFLQWIFGASKIVRAASVEKLRYTPGWSVVWFLIPFANFFMPYLVMKEVWQVSHAGKDSSRSALDWWWCFCFVRLFFGAFWSVFSNPIVRLMLDQFTDHRKLNFLVDLVINGLNVGVYVTTLIVVSRIVGAIFENDLLHTKVSNPALGELEGKSVKRRVLLILLLVFILLVLFAIISFFLLQLVAVSPARY